jgi:catalase
MPTRRTKIRRASVAGAPAPTPVRTSGQVTSADAQPARRQNSARIQDLERDMLRPGKELTTNQGVGISDDQNSLRSSVRGPTLMEDILMREKITHFDHERIPERVVHARGVGAHGYFQAYKDLSRYTMASFLTDTHQRTRHSRLPLELDPAPVRVARMNPVVVLGIGVSR